ncbi:hypothetical protein C8J57DRAFT_1533283 [Mycena rebaudengoi]|nr:hypothetical protein C8J57DRAFT_1533283 [Mycena rebaudengoi]
MPSTGSLSARSSSPDAPTVTPDIDGDDNASVAETNDGGASPLLSTPWIAILRNTDSLLLDPVEALRTPEFGDLFQYLIDPSLLDEATKMDVTEVFKDALPSIKLWFDDHSPKNAPDWVRAAFCYVPELLKWEPLPKTYLFPPHDHFIHWELRSSIRIADKNQGEGEEEQGDVAEETDAHVAGDSNVDEEPVSLSFSLLSQATWPSPDPSTTCPSASLPSMSVSSSSNHPRTFMVVHGTSPHVVTYNQVHKIPEASVLQRTGVHVIHGGVPFKFREAIITKLSHECT